MYFTGGLVHTWVLRLYFMDLNLSNHQIGQELDPRQDDRGKGWTAPGVWQRL